MSTSAAAFTSRDGRAVMIAHMRVSRCGVANLLAATNARDRRYRFGHAVSEDYASDWLSRSDYAAAAVCAIGVADSTIVGIANVVEIGARCSELALLVRSDRQSVGIGSALALHCAMQAERAATTLVSFVEDDNARAMRVLTRCGFRSRGFAIGAIEYVRSPEGGSTRS